jgi:hypothetical protein
MFSRVVAVNSKEGKATQRGKTIQEQILPILQSQPGFVDEIVLISPVSRTFNVDAFSSHNVRAGKAA